MNSNAASTPIGYRLAVTSRVLAAVLGGNVLAPLGLRACPWVVLS